jgi:hypothetical protein
MAAVASWVSSTIKNSENGDMELNLENWTIKVLLACLLERDHLSRSSSGN